MFPLYTCTLELAEAPEAPGVQPRTFTFIASTGTKDRNGNIYDPQGWDISTYKKNPVVLLSHRWDEPPIGAAKDIWLQGDRLMARITFAATPKAQEISDLIEHGFIRALSAGSLPLAFDILRDETTGRPTGIHSHRQELVELSVVNFPANPDTLRTAALQAVTDNHEAQVVAAALRAAKELIWTPKT